MSLHPVERGLNVGCALLRHVLAVLVVGAVVPHDLPNMGVATAVEDLDDGVIDERILSGAPVTAEHADIRVSRRRSGAQAKLRAGFVPAGSSPLEVEKKLVARYVTMIMLVVSGLNERKRHVVSGRVNSEQES